MKSRRAISIVAAALIGLAMIAPFTSSYVIILLTHALIFAILAMSVDLLLG